MKTYKNIEFEINEGVAIITLNRTDVLNSFNFEMADETIDALTYSRDEKIIRAIVLTANGKGFCAGQDLEEATGENGPNIEDSPNTITKAGEEFKSTTIFKFSW